MQKEREAKRKQAQARKEAEAQARLLVLKVFYFVIYSRFDFSILIGRTRAYFKSETRRRNDRAACY